MQIQKHPAEKEINKLVRIWEKSVKATHDFLKSGDIAFYRPFVEEFIRRVKIYTATEKGRTVAFMGLSDDCIEMLFVSPEKRKSGYGTELLNIAICDEGIRKVDVNEQNTQALNFYLSKGFEIAGRDDTDGFGKPYPILHLQLPQAEVIETARLRLRPFSIGDLQAFHTICSDGQIADAGGWKRHVSEDESKGIMCGYFLNRKDVWAIELKTGGGLIGAIGFNADTRRSNPDARNLGYWLGRQHWGHGYMTEAAKAATACAYTKLGIGFVTAACFTGNHRSYRVLEKCGFIKEGVLHFSVKDENGSFRDEYIFYLPK